jgi:hypothetical protein
MDVKRNGFDDLLNEHVAKAHARGLRVPVIALVFDSPRGTLGQRLGRTFEQVSSLSED